MRKLPHPLCTIVFLVSLGCAACVPLTLSNEGAINFSTCASVYIAPLEGADWSFPMVGDGYLDGYLGQEMTDHSGFETVTSNPGDTVDLYLYVSIVVTEDLETTTDSDGSTDTKYKYQAIARFEARDAAYTLVDQGSVDYKDEDRDDAIEDALDEVVLHYLPPYRI